jgi:pimeloyl-ACP methyl ester carboxylesterase
MGKNEIVILLHGIGHSSWSMMLLERFLKAADYKTLNISYPSRRYTIEYLADCLSKKIDRSEVWEKSDKVHFVGHSMGGLVVGLYLDQSRNLIPHHKMGRVVMLGTPHGGSEVADFLQHNFLYKMIFGPAGQELTTAHRETQKILPWYDLEMVAGTKNWLYPLGMLCIKSPHDGCVSVASTRLEGMKDHITMLVLHGNMPHSLAVQKQVLAFLKSGKFLSL